MKNFATIFGPFPPARGSSFRRVVAFTLVELIVVIVIISILAGVLAPAVLRSAARQVQSESQAAQRLLTIAAERDALSTEPIAIEYDDASSELRLLVRRINTTAVSGAGGTNGNAWRQDPGLFPVVFSSARLTQALADGRPLPRKGWRVVFSQVEPRPSLVLQIDPKTDGQGSRDTGSRVGFQVSLGTDAPAAERSGSTANGGRGPLLASDRSIDLDAAGRGQKPW